MKNRYYWLLLLVPFVGLAVLAVILYSKPGNGDWDDDDDDEGGGRGHRTELADGSGIDSFTDDNLNSNN